jgi:hypothetical protein
VHAFAFAFASAITRVQTSAFTTSLARRDINTSSCFHSLSFLLHQFRPSIHQHSTANPYHPQFPPHFRDLYDKMATGSIIDQRFTDWINEATDLADQGLLEECVVKARELLADDACPRYHRMKTLLLLAAVLDDWYQANECRQDADALWRIVRRWHPVGENETLDTYMAEIRDLLDVCREALAQEEPSDGHEVEDDVAGAQQSDCGCTGHNAGHTGTIQGWSCQSRSLLYMTHLVC